MSIRPPIHARVPVQHGPAGAMKLDSYANVLLDFRDWCIARGVDFRTGMIDAVALFVSSNAEERRARFIHRRSTRGTIQGALCSRGFYSCACTW